MAVTFVRTTPEEVVHIVSEALLAALKSHKRVLWIVPGGSNVSLVVHIMEHISAEASVGLAIMLSDERFGPIGHPDSNLQQLYDAGLQPKRATVIPVLRPEVPLAETTELYGKVARAALEAADVSIAMFGMGPDGHVGGILPSSPAVTAKTVTASYETPEFTRITLTPVALAHINHAFISAFGEAKLEALTNLRDKKLPIVKQPAQLLKKLSQLTVLNDQIGGNE